MAPPGLEIARAAIVRIFPDLGSSRFTHAATSWHSMAVDVDDRLIFKFPRDDIAERALVREASVLAVVRPSVSMTVPDLSIERGPPLFSRHPKLKGGHLLTADYDALPEDARRRLGNDLAHFYTELHRLDGSRMAAAGALPIGAWQTTDAIRSRALPALSPPFQEYAKQAIAEFERLRPDPYGDTYGFFDGHGRNMAFDHAHGRINGIYDFADSGFGPLHQDFICSNFISPDLTGRIVSAYEALTGRLLDRGRIALLTSIHRLSELAELADDPAHAPAMIRGVTDWAAVRLVP